MKLIENEKILMKNTSGEMTLTNYRVIKSKIKGGITTYTSMQLEKISSIHFKSHNYKWLLYIGIFICCAGTIVGLNSRNDAAPAIISSCFFGGLFIAAYFLLRIQVLTISTTGGERTKLVTNEKFESAFKFIHAIEHVAKNGNLPTISEAPAAKSKIA